MDKASLRRLVERLDVGRHFGAAGLLPDRNAELARLLDLGCPRFVGISDPVDLLPDGLGVELSIGAEFSPLN